MTRTEVTGQPCSGKTNYIHSFSSREEYYLFTDAKIERFINFIFGFFYLGIIRSFVLYKWCMKESVPFYFKVVIFLNAISKFGFVFESKKFKDKKNRKSLLVDEGISHLPFLLQQTNPKSVINFIENELRSVEIIFIRSPDLITLRERMLSRGHKRLAFIGIDEFLKKNAEIELCLLERYPTICKKININ